MVELLAAWLLPMVVAEDWLLTVAASAAEAAWGLLVALAARGEPKAQLLSSVASSRNEQAHEERRVG